MNAAAHPTVANTDALALMSAHATALIAEARECITRLADNPATHPRDGADAAAVLAKLDHYLAAPPARRVVHTGAV